MKNIKQNNSKLNPSSLAKFSALGLASRYFIFSALVFIVLICIAILGCRNGKALNLADMVIQSHPMHNGVRILDEEGHLLFDQSQYIQPKSVDYLMHTIHHPIWSTEGVDKEIPAEFLHLNYAALMRQNRDSIGIHFVNTFLKKLSINKLLDFRTTEGQALAKIIFCIEYGDNIESMDSTITIASIPEMPFLKKRADDRAVIDMDSTLHLYNDGYFTSREFLDIIKNKTLIEQFCNVSTLNGTVMLGVQIRSSNKGKEDLNRHDISIYYQFIENQLLQIGKIDINPYRVHSFE